MTHEDSSQPGRKRRASGDEGAPYTKQIAAEMAGRRTALGWSAEQLAQEMTSAGVPWTREVVVNLETGRRKTLAVHELMALCWVLDVDDPVDLLVPPSLGGDPFAFPVTPTNPVTPDAVRAWIRGQTGPLRILVESAEKSFSEVEESVRSVISEHWEEHPIAGKTPEEWADQIIKEMREKRPGRGALGLPAIIKSRSTLNQEKHADGSL